MTESAVVGVDLGGTKIHAGVVGPGGRVLGQARVPTGADREAQVILADMVAAVERALSEAGRRLEDIPAVGVGSPAPLDPVAGIVLSPANLPTLHGFPLVARLSEALGRRVVLNNDANCFGLAEARFGAGAGAAVCCGLTLGTGLGAFLVIGGEVYNGPRGAATEIWCSPYLGDHVEERVSGRGVARNYRKLTGRTGTAEQLERLARDGDGRAQEAWREFGRDLAAPVAWLSNAADPDVFVLGGSLAKAWDLFEGAMQAELGKYLNAVTARAMRVEPAALGDAAGMIGAAALVLS